MPRPATAKQRAAAALYHEEAERRAKRLGMSRREFVRSAAGTATAFMVMNLVNGLPSSGGASPLPITPEQCDDPDAARALFEREHFVMDVQLHHVDLTPFPPNVQQALAAVVCDLRFLEPQLACADRLTRLERLNFVKEVFIDSETAVGVISGVPNGVPLPVSSMKETRDLVNTLAGSERALSQAMIDPKANLGTSTALDSFESQVMGNGACAVKCYTGNGQWWLDSEADAYPLFAEAERLGLSLINVHKGFPSLLGPGSAQFVTTRDVAQATLDWPQLNFAIYHSGYFPDGTGISGFLADVAAMGPRSNLYAEVGSTLASVFLEGADAAAHLIGSLLRALGSWRVLWGTDSIWWGSPQWQIDLFKVLQIPESLQESHGYPPLTDRVRERILGLNAARLYGVDVAAKRCEIAEDQLTAARAEAHRDGSTRTHMSYGPATPEELAYVLAHDGHGGASA